MSDFCKKSTLYIHKTLQKLSKLFDISKLLSKMVTTGVRCDMAYLFEKSFPYDAFFYLFQDFNTPKIFLKNVPIIPPRWFLNCP